MKSSPKQKRPVTAKLSQAIEAGKKHKLEQNDPKLKIKKKKQQILKAQALSKGRFMGSGLSELPDHTWGDK